MRPEIRAFPAKVQRPLAKIDRPWLLRASRFFLLPAALFLSQTASAADEPPTITAAPTDQTVAAGDPVTLTVTATGSAPLAYQWYRDGLPVDGATAATLEFAAVQPSDGGRYSVRVSNPFGIVDATGLTNVVKIFAGVDHNLLLTDAGDVWSVGRNLRAQLGDGNVNWMTTPQFVARDIADAAAGSRYSLFLDIDGTLWGVGANSNGSLGDGTTITRTAPIWVADDVVKIAAGGGHSLFVKSDGTLWAMGSNWSGQLGDGTTDDRTAPVQIASDVADVSAGDIHTLFVKTDQTLWAAGGNTNGQLGDGTTTDRYLPVQVASNVVKISAGGGHSLFLKSDLTLWAMGANSYGNLGDGTTVDRYSPVQVDSDVAELAAGGAHSLYFKNDGTLWGMGGNYIGQLGDGTGENHSTPVQIASDVVAISAGPLHSVFVDDSGTAWSMGSNSYGLLGDGTTTDRLSPVRMGELSSVKAELEVTLPVGYPIILDQPDAQSLVIDDDISFTVEADGSAPLAYQWLKDGAEIPGANASTYTVLGAQSGDAGGYSVRVSNAVGEITSQVAALGLNPPAITAYPTNQTALSGQNLEVSLSATGSVPLNFRWYRDGVAVSDTASALLSVPSATADDAGSYSVTVSNAAGSGSTRFAMTTSFAAGREHALFVKSDGTLWGMGKNGLGQLGLGDLVQGKSTPAQLADQVVKVASGRTHSLFLKTDGTLWGMGTSLTGELGDGGFFFYRTTPIQIASDVRAMAGGNSYSLFIKTDDTLWGTGTNYYGQFGDTTTDDQVVPVQVGTDVLAVAAGIAHTLILKTDHTLWTTGRNDSGQLGNNSTTDISTPVQIASDVLAVAAGGSHSLYLKSDHTLWAMGNNDYGQLGDGTRTSSDVPIQVATDVTAIAAGEFHTLFLKADSTLWSVGRNQYGQLGDYTLFDRTSPQLVASGVRDIAAGAKASYFTRLDDSLWAMGDMFDGQLGIGDVFWTQNSIGAGPRRRYPVPVKSGVTESFANIITASPVSQTVAAGSQVNLEVQVVGPGSKIYQWLKDDIAIGGANSSLLRIEHTAESDAGVYKVSVGDGDTTAVSNDATLTVVVPPSITSMPTTQVAELGGTVEFTVAVSGTGPFSYQWFKDGIAIEGATSATLSISNAQNSDVGEYSVAVSNAVATVDSDLGIQAKIAASWGHSLFIDRDGALWATGADGYGELGDGLTANRNTPIAVQSGVRSVAAGDDHTFFIQDDGDVWGVGINTSSQLGDGSSTNRYNPVYIAPWTERVATSDRHSLFLRADHKLAATGLNSFAQLGSINGPINVPKQSMIVEPLLRAVDTGADHTLMLDLDGGLWTRGRNNHGQLGIGTADSDDHSTPSFVVGDVVAIAAGDDHSLFIKTDGTLWAMGLNSFGQLGDGTTTDRASPVQVASGVMAVAAGDFHSLYIKTDGTLWATGNNGSGQLGDGTTTDRTSPVQVATGAMAAAAGTDHSLLVKADGTLWSFGRNQNGQLGDGTNVNRNTPVQIPGLIMGGRTRLEIGVPPEILVSPVAQNVTVGESVQFAVSVTGTEPFSYQWQKGGVDIEGATGAIFEIASVQAGDAGDYRVVVTNAVAEVTSSAATLTVNVPPAIVTPPMAQTVNAGDSIGLSITVSGTGPFSYQWRKDGVDIEGATESTFEILVAAMGDSGLYTVVVTNVAGDITSDEIEVAVSGQVTTPSGSNVAVVPPPVDPDGLPVSGGPAVNLDFGNVLTPGVTTLTVSEAGPDVPGNFYLGDSLYLDIETTATFDGLIQVSVDYSSLTLAVDPSELMLAHFDGSSWVDITTSNDLVNQIIYGETATLSPFALLAPVSVALGNLTQEYDGVPKPATATTSPNGLTVQLTYDGSDSAPTNPGEYAVEATIVDATYVGSASGTLTINGAPIIVDPPAAQSVAKGDSVTLSANVATTPGASYQWYKDGVAVSGATDATYTISYPTPNEAGSYTVVVTNAYGEAISAAADVTVNYARLTALATRALAGQDANTLIPGIFIGGDRPKSVVLRAQVSILEGLGVPNLLSDPRLTLLDFPAGNLLGENDDWGGDPDLADAFAAVGLAPLDPGSVDAAFLADLNPGLYTALVSGTSSQLGVTNLEVYDAALNDYHANLNALAVRSFSGAGADVMIVGIVIEGNMPARMVIRGVGPSLGDSVPGRAADPELLLYDFPAGNLIASNDNWGGDPDLAAAFAEVGLTVLDPASLDAAIVADLNPGIYTVHVRGVANTTGIVLMEVYQRP